MSERAVPVSSLKALRKRWRAEATRVEKSAAGFGSGVGNTFAERQLARALELHTAANQLDRLIREAEKGGDNE